MKIILSLFLLMLVFTGQVFAWGQTGHRAVGLIAEQHLNKKTRKAVLRVLQNNSVAEVSNWMDDIKSDQNYSYANDWHWVTILDGTTYEQSAKNPKGDLIMKIEELTSALKSKKLSTEKEQESLKFLIHLVGDLHQPLHVGGKDDSGGNDVKLQWFNQPSNLHRVWDSDMIDAKDLSYTELAGFLGKPSKQQIKDWQAGTVRDWAHGMMIYRKQVYNIPEDKKLGYRYSYENFDTVQKLLLQGGVRLAGLLKEIYG
ncbi:MAG: S1/P1 nuclease [Acidobacteriota bacterium]|nr:S1/P1 nuclease [Acidobacteriota bacterium]